MASDLGQLEIAWAAGFFDGEGCVQIKHYRPGKHLNRTSYSLTIKVVNTKLVALERFQRLFGGTIQYTCSKSETNRQESWRWSTYGKVAKRVLAAMLPWLVVRRQQAKLALAFPIHGATPVGLPIGIWTQQRRAYARLRILNRCGVRDGNKEEMIQPEAETNHLRLIREA